MQSRVFGTESARDALVARARKRAAERGLQRAEEREVTMEEVKRHSKGDDLWVVIEGRVYDLGAFDSHPGGRGILEQAAGRDVSDVFRVTHTPAVQQEKERFCIASLAGGGKRSELMAEFHAVDAELQGKGWYDTDLSYYAAKVAVQSALFAAALLPFVLGVEIGYCWATWSAVALGVFWHQLAFIGHDLGHNAVFHDRAGRDYIGSLLVTLFFGVSGQWWKKSHNVHHVVTNAVQGDPDIQHLPVFAVSERQFDGVWSFYHKRHFLFDRVARVLVPWQHWLYIPIMCLARHNLYLQSYLMVFTDRDCRNWKTELATLLGFAWWLMELTMRIDTAGVALYWWLLSHGICGLLHVQITLSHFSMETFDTQPGTIHRFEGDDYLRHQLATSLDVDCPRSLDWLHGGLQFQAVHHLWPRLPRHRLREARDKYLLPLCKRHGLEYHSLPFGPAVLKTLVLLKQQAEEATRRSPNTPAPTSMLSDMVNMAG
eukprot:Hpha_TRINITY_DN6756_c0_g2::TRINITY_DN6756_c0_g2_i1::g.110851::m.110851/K13076/SLD; sphingolipid 8-(E)-desaturase